ncbi:hypothetical protein [Dietzia sp. 179-F 9C3 NHS]|uniref:hypothetical protein n=1 Tax=Dietzia sp. 179-F 9C3 NHS TaxID=3374295 RepID=UPI003879CF89
MDATDTHTIASLTNEYCRYGASRRFVRAQAESIAATFEVNLGADTDPLPDEVADELICDLDEQAEQYEESAPERQAAYDDQTRALGGRI